MTSSSSNPGGVEDPTSMSLEELLLRGRYVERSYITLKATLRRIMILNRIIDRFFMI